MEEDEHVPAEGVSVEEDVTGAIESLPTDQPQPLLQSDIALPAAEDGRSEDTTMNQPQEEHTGGSVPTVSHHKMSGVDCTPVEVTADQLSATPLEFREEGSQSKQTPQTVAASIISSEDHCGEKKTQPRSVTAGDVSEELSGEEGGSSSSTEPERTGTKSDVDRRLHLNLPHDLSPEVLDHESGSALPSEFTRLITRAICFKMSGLRLSFLS